MNYDFSLEQLLRISQIKDELNRYKANAENVLDTISHRETNQIPLWFFHILEHEMIDRLSGVPIGTYIKNPKQTYNLLQQKAGVNFIDQYLWENPLIMGAHGYENAEYGATTGATTIIVNDMPINSPEDVIQHLEKYEIPNMQKKLKDFSAEKFILQLGESELEIQKDLGMNILKTGYASIMFPLFLYETYGYINYFSAFALYPEMIEKYFSAAADYMCVRNQAVLEAYKLYDLPKLNRIDHDITDSRGTLVAPEDLEKLWYPYMYKALAPIVNSDINLIWHCDGNVNAMIDPLIDIGINGFQGFQYEDGVDYASLCKKKTKKGENLFIIAGLSVTRTLPFGTPNDIKNELKFLVENGPKTGLALGLSSSCVPGVSYENLKTAIEGLQYYSRKGR